MICSFRLTDHEAALASLWAFPELVRPVKPMELRWPYGGPGDTLNLHDHRGQPVRVSKIDRVVLVDEAPDSLPEAFRPYTGPCWIVELTLLNRKDSELLRRTARANGCKGGRKRWKPSDLEADAPEGATVERQGRFVVMRYRDRELKFSTVKGYRTFVKTLLGG